MITEAIYTSLFLLDFIWYAYVHFAYSDSIISFFSKGAVWIDLITIVPVFVSYALRKAGSTTVFMIFRFLRIFTVVKNFHKLHVSLSEVQRQISQLLLTILSIIFVAAGGKLYLFHISIDIYVHSFISYIYFFIFLLNYLFSHTLLLFLFFYFVFSLFLSCWLAFIFKISKHIIYTIRFLLLLFIMLSFLLFLIKNYI